MVVDANRTLGHFVAPHVADLLGALSPLSRGVIREASRRVLHRVPTLHGDVVEDFCRSLLINPADWPDSWPRGRFEAYPYAAGALDEVLAELECPAVVLTNLPCLTGPGRMADLQDQLPRIGAVYTSYEMGTRKPDPTLWWRIAGLHGAAPERMLHIGDEWGSDVLGAIAAGCRAIYLTTDQQPAPPVDLWPAPADRIRVARNLRDARQIVTSWE